MASFVSHTANEILRTKRDILNSMSFDDVIALMTGLSAIAAQKPGAAAMTDTNTALTAASATVPA